MRCLLIETSTHNCSVAISRDDTLEALVEVNEKNIHSRNLGLFIQKVLEEAGATMNQLDAVSVGKGPGSYTGLRIGVSMAKSIAYSLDIPLVSVNTLASMAAQMKQHANNTNALFCPMLDARRMEVYAAFFDSNLDLVQNTMAIIIDEGAFKEILDLNEIYFAGEGMPKSRPYLEKHANSKFFEDIQPSASFMIKKSMEKLQDGDVENVATFEPFYLKAFVPKPANKMSKLLNKKEGP